MPESAKGEPRVPIFLAIKDLTDGVYARKTARGLPVSQEETRTTQVHRFLNEPPFSRNLGDFRHSEAPFARQCSCLSRWTPSMALLSLREEQSGREMGLAEKRNRAHLYPPACPPWQPSQLVSNRRDSSKPLARSWELDPSVLRSRGSLVVALVIFSPFSLFSLSDNFFGVNAVSPPVGLTRLTPELSVAWNTHPFDRREHLCLFQERKNKGEKKGEESPPCPQRQRIQGGKAPLVPILVASLGESRPHFQSLHPRYTTCLNVCCYVNVL